MKQKIIWILLAALILIAAAGCDEPAAVTENETYVMHFQDGNYPTTSYIGCPDTGIRSTLPDYNYGASTSCYLGTVTTAGLYGVYRILLKFDFSHHIVEQNFTITKAYLSVYSNGYSGSAATKSKIYAYPMTRSWSEGGESGSTATGSNDATWNTPNSGSWDTSGGDFEATPMSYALLEPDVKLGHFIMELDTEIIQGWMDGSTENYGFILKYNGENSSTQNYFRIYLSDYENAFHRPKLTIFYTID